MSRDYFGERIAERYDETAADMFQAAVVEPVVDLLVGLGFDGAALGRGIGRAREAPADMFQAAVVEPVFDLLADLAFDGTALELGIGTGRIALPLAQRGIRVHGIDLSEAMVARLRAKPGAEQIEVTI